MWSKLRIFWGAYETPASLDFYLYRRHAPILRLPLPGFGLLGPFALLGCVLAWPRRGWPRLIVVISVATSLLVTMFFVLTRFRMVLMPALCVLAAFGAVELLTRIRGSLSDGRRLPALVAVTLVATFGVLVNLPVQATTDSWRYAIAGLLQLPRQLETTARAHWNLGVHYAARANERPDPAALLTLAEEQLREALHEDAQPGTYLELGKVLARSQRNEEALEVYRKVAELEPRNYRTQHVLGLLHRRVGDLEAAETAFRRALSIARQHTASIVQLGEVLLERGRNAEAAELFRRALILRPDNRRARAGLAAAEPR
jgi:Tfp pilus assembly protein PilF